MCIPYKVWRLIKEHTRYEDVEEFLGRRLTIEELQSVDERREEEREHRKEVEAWNRHHCPAKWEHF